MAPKPKRTKCFKVANFLPFISGNQASLVHEVTFQNKKKIVTNAMAATTSWIRLKAADQRALVFSCQNHWNTLRASRCWNSSQGFFREFRIRVVDINKRCSFSFLSSFPSSPFLFLISPLSFSQFSISLPLSKIQLGVYCHCKLLQCVRQLTNSFWCILSPK